MNKSDLINEVAKVVSNKREAQAAVDCILFWSLWDSYME